MLDMSPIRGFYDPELVDARWCFHSFESIKTLKKTLRGFFFIQFSILSPKEIHRSMTYPTLFSLFFKLSKNKEGLELNFLDSLKLNKKGKE